MSLNLKEYGRTLKIWDTLQNPSSSYFMLTQFFNLVQPFKNILLKYVAKNIFHLDL